MELPLAGMDVVEVAPPYDHAEVTAFLASRVVLEALSGIAWRRRRAAGLPRAPAPADPLLARPRSSAARAAPARASPGRIGRVTGIEPKDQAGL